VRRLSISLATASILVLSLAGTALAWAAPNLTALCAEDENTYAWRVTFSQDEPNFVMELLWDSSTTPFDTINFGADAHLSGPHDFTTPRGGTVLKIRFQSDTGAKDTATANAELCNPPSEPQSEPPSEPQSEPPSEPQSEPPSEPQSEPQSEPASEPEGSVGGGTGTPNASIPDTAAAPATGTAVGTLLFGVLLLASLGSLAYANARAGRR
jgi:hypothetical protein